MRRVTAVFATMLLSATICAGARAAVFDFTLTGSRDARFSIDTSVAPSFFSSSPLIGDQVAYDNVAGIFGGVAGIAPSVGFGDAPILADFQISGTSLGFTQFGGPTLFTGTAADISFLPGTYDLTSIVSGASTLTIAAAAAAVPEPGSWLLLLTFAAAGFTVHRRTRRGAAVVAA